MLLFYYMVFLCHDHLFHKSFPSKIKTLLDETHGIFDPGYHVSEVTTVCMASF